jgi:hypothetical protein
MARTRSRPRPGGGGGESSPWKWCKSSALGGSGRREMIEDQVECALVCAAVVVENPG